MIVDADFFAASYEDPKKSKVAGKVGYALIPAGPGGKTYSGPVDLGAGDQQGDQEQGSGLAVRGVGDRAAHPAQRHPRLSQLQSVARLDHATTRACRRSWGRGAAAAT